MEQSCEITNSVVEVIDIQEPQVIDLPGDILENVGGGIVGFSL